MNQVDVPDDMARQLDKQAHLDAHEAAQAASQEVVDEGKVPAVLGYVPFLFFVPLFGNKNNEFALRHGRQALALFVIEIVALLFLMDVVSEFFWTVVFVACLGLALLGGVHAAQGKYWDIPYLSQILKKYDIFRDHRDSQ